MLGDITAAGELYIVTGYTDMRKSIDGLCATLKTSFTWIQDAVLFTCSVENAVTG